MATKSRTLVRIVSKTMAAGSEHAMKALKGLPEAAGAAVEDLLAGSKVRPAAKTATRKAVKTKAFNQKKPGAKAGSQRKKTKQ